MDQAVAVALINAGTQIAQILPLFGNHAVRYEDIPGRVVQRATEVAAADGRDVLPVDVENAAVEILGALLPDAKRVLSEFEGLVKRRQEMLENQA